MSVRRAIHLGFALCLLVVTACSQDKVLDAFIAVPSWFPPIEFPEDNSPNAVRIALGRRLFYEPLLSVDSSISCASCHLQMLAFTDGRQVSAGVDNRIGHRNAPTLANVAYVTHLNADGGIPTLEMQSQAPIFAHEEMGFTIGGFLERITNDATYIALFNQAYGREPDAFGISRGLATFQRTFISSASRFDQFEYQGVSNALSADEIRGRELFFSNDNKCSVCHTPPLFTTFEFANIGLYTTYEDSGRARITNLSSDNGKFRIPTLRNIALTAPYMHDGSMTSLQQVVQHFNAGGSNHPNQDAHVAPLNLSSQQQSDLVAFLHTLTDDTFVSNPDLSKP